MKLRRVLLVTVLVVILLIGSVAAVNAAKMRRVVGGMNYDYDAAGWAWFELNVTYDPVTEEVNGFTHYKSYTTEKPKDWGGWRGEPVCANFTEYEGNPAVIMVVRIVEALGDNTVTPGWFVKFLTADGGPHASNDYAGLMIFPPIEEEPDCSFDDPIFWDWYGVNGNITIH